MGLIAILETIPLFSDETQDTQNSIFVTTECLHERRGARIPQTIFVNTVYEYCKDCSEITRIKKY